MSRCTRALVPEPADEKKLRFVGRQLLMQLWLRVECHSHRGWLLCAVVLCRLVAALRSIRAMSLLCGRAHSDCGLVDSIAVSLCTVHGVAA